ncbi:hypothetical protein Tco_0000291 [Tanacetum coccineum]
MWICSVILYLPLETPENPFVAPANVNTIEVFMNRVGYQGVVDKVSAFYTKNLAQPRQTMFKVFNRCLTIRTSGHNQTKINILQLFHVVLNQTHVDYAALLWWDFMNNVFSKKESIQYPRFIKLIITDLMKKFPNIPKRLEEDYHSIKDDVPLIRETDDFKEYETVFMKKRKKIAGEYSSPQQSLKITIKQKQTVEKDDDDSEDMIEPESHKDNPEELTDIVSNSTTSTFKHSQVKKRISKKYSHLPGALRRMCRRQDYMIQDMERKCVTTAKFWETHNKIDDILHEEFKAHAPAIIEELFKNYVPSNVIHVHPTTTTSTEIESSVDLQYQLYLKMKRNLQDRADDIALWEALRRKFEKSSTSNTSCREDDFHSHHDEHQDDDAPPEGEKRVKRSKTIKRSKSVRGSPSKHSRKDSTTFLSKQQSQHQEWDAWEEENVVDEDKYGNTEKKKYILSLHKIHAEEFPELDLKEKLNRWVQKEFKTFNEDARLSIRHWKDS